MSLSEADIKMIERVIAPSLGELTGAIDLLKTANSSEHATLTLKVNEMELKVNKTYGRLFISNGERALVEEHRDVVEDIIKLKKVSHAPTMSRQRITQDGLKITGGVGIFALLNAACGYMATNWDNMLDFFK